MRENSIIREGATAGLVGATAVAVWFLAVDMLAGHVLYTPEVLGRALISVLGPAQPDSIPVVVGVYTVIHYLAFIIIGIVVTAIIHAGKSQTAVLAGGLILFVIIEIGFLGFITAMLSEVPALGTLAWYQIGAANLIATLLMGAYLWHMHPSIGQQLNFALGGREEPVAHHPTGRAV